MAIQISNIKLAPNNIAKIMTMASGAVHGFADILVSNFGGTDSKVYVYIGSGTSPTPADIVIPNSLIVSGDSRAISCMPVQPGESIWAVTEADSISVRVSILAKAAA